MHVSRTRHLATAACVLVAWGCGATSHKRIDAETAAEIALKKARGTATPEEEEALRQYIEGEDDTDDDDE